MLDTMIGVWTTVERASMATSAAELVIFTAILYWLFTSSRVADMLEVVGERVGGWCGRESSGAASLRQAVRARKRHHHNDIYTRIDHEKQARAQSLYRVKEGPVIPPPEPIQRPLTGLACRRCAPISRESWRDPSSTDSGAVINILDIGRQNYANGGVVSRCFCDLAQCSNLQCYDYSSVEQEVEKDERFQQAIEETLQKELKSQPDVQAGGDAGVERLRERIRKRAMRVLADISSAMSNNVLKVVAWICHKGLSRVSRGGCGTGRWCVGALRRAGHAGLPLVFVPLHRSHLDYILVTFTLYLTGLRPPLVAAGDNMRIPFFGWILRGCGAFYIRRKVEGSEYHSDAIYKSALRAYILNSLGAKNNLEFFIEGGRTRTGKPQLPKAGILSVIVDAYLDGTINDALLVPVTLNYERLVDGNFVREQLGRPKQMETFWSALRGIWRTLNTDHGGIRVDFNQPISLKELVQSFQKCYHLKSPTESLLPSSNDSLAVNLDRQILYNNSHSSLYGADVSTDHKMMVEAIGRHLVYDASRSTALMSTNVVAYCVLSSRRVPPPSLAGLVAAVGRESRTLVSQHRDLGYQGADGHVTRHALDMLGPTLIRVSGRGEKAIVSPVDSIPALLELSYYANSVIAHYAPHAIVATALESILCTSDDQSTVSESELIDRSMLLSCVLSSEFILSPPCGTIKETLLQVVQDWISTDLLATNQTGALLEEERWSRRFARALEQDTEDTEIHEQKSNVKYKVNNTESALNERRRLIISIRGLLEAYSATCTCLTEGSQKEVEKNTLDHLTDEFTNNRMIYGEAVSTDAIRNCLRLLKQWGVINLQNEGKDRRIKILHPYDNNDNLQQICSNIYRFNMDTPLLKNLQG